MSMTKIYFKITFVFALAISFLACEKEEGNTITVNYPSGIEYLAKQVDMRIDFSSEINPDTTKYTYDNFKVSSVTTSRDNYRFDYTYNDAGQLVMCKRFDNASNDELATSEFTYSEGKLLIEIFNEDGSRDSLVWALQGDKGIECKRYFFKTTTAAEYLYQYDWSAENVKDYKEYRRINYSSSFNDFEQFPEDMERTLENIIDFYRLEMLEEGSEFYLVKHNNYESFNDVVNVDRYVSTEVPVLQSQQVPKIHSSRVYDEDKRSYYTYSGYTNCINDEIGYPDRVVTGGADNIRLDFKY